MSFTLQATSQAQTELRRRVRPEDVVLPVMSTNSLQAAGRVRLSGLDGDGGAELVRYTGFGVDAVGMPTLTGCTRAADREQGGGAGREWPGGTFVVQAPYERPELVGELPAATVDQVGRQVFREGEEPNLTLIGRDIGGPLQRNISKIPAWNIFYSSDFGGDGLTDGLFGEIRGIAAHPSGGSTFVSSDNRIQSFTALHAYIETIATAGSGDGQVDTPKGMYFSVELGLLFVADSGNDRIQWFDEDGDWVGKLGTSGAGAANLDNPSAVFVRSLAPDGLPDEFEMFIADTGNDRISTWRRDAGGTWSAHSTTLQPPGLIDLDWKPGGLIPRQLKTFNDAGEGQVAYQTSQFNVLGEEGRDLAQIGLPYNAKFDPAGNIFVTDTANDRVGVWDGQGQFRGIFGPDEFEPNSLRAPTALHVGRTSLFVADSTSRVIRVYGGFIESPYIDVDDDRLLISSGSGGGVNQFAFSASEITANRKRTLTVPDKDGTLAMLDDVPATSDVTNWFRVITAQAGAVGNNSTVTWATHASTTAVLPAGTWDVHVHYTVSMTSVIAATWQGEARVGAPAVGTVGNAAAGAGGRSSISRILSTSVVSDGVAATTFTGEFKRNAGDASGNITTENGSLIAVCRRTA